MRFLLVALMALTLAAHASASEVMTGWWTARLDSPGGELEFGLDFEKTDAGLRAVITNAEERIEIDDVKVVDGRIRIGFPHYDAELAGAVLASGRLIVGSWRKVGRNGAVSELPFRAARTMETGRAPGVDIGEVEGRWRVDFESSDEPAVAEFRAGPGGRLFGTFLTTTGDYRFLEGAVRGGALALSCFDGAHAFLFRATVQPDGSLRGDFWSRDVWHETWTAVRDPDAALPDGFGETAWVGAQDLSSLVFRDLDGEPTSVASLHEAGKPMILEVFGSWCPNCHDAAALLGELEERYADRGLRIVGLAFEHTGDFERDARQVRRYAERYGIRYPLLLAGLSDKARAGEAMPVLDRVRAYPTTIFIDGEGRVRAIHTGFSGPATGEAHERLRASFERLVEDLLPG
jgi:thiol-disulfide isomerase/thioredoxin